MQQGVQTEATCYIQQCTGLIFAMFTSPIIHLVSLTKFCISIVLSFSFDDCITHEKLKTKVRQNYGGKQGVSWWICNLHISHNTAVQGEIEDTGYAKFGGKTRRIMGEVQMANMSWCLCNGPDSLKGNEGIRTTLWKLLKSLGFTCDPWNNKNIILRAWVIKDMKSRCYNNLWKFSFMLSWTRR